ncbi:PLP-dependent aminotransferase family protein [Alicyclobacillus suci]|uniref:aminotransferase-like domain-containing protein n=1 Tax=Alicyclobacillus suci TaxID=2816080 RepID=UPI002E29E455|nr:PLP-dependent aminotransferase family protein [Alicyclobacillus suci]
MNKRELFPPSVRAALQYPAPGAWMPEVPPGAIRLSAGYPDTSLIPTVEFVRSIQALVQEERDLPFHYLGSRYATNLRQWARNHLASRGIGVDGAQTQLLITAGAIQGLDLIARVLLDSTRAVLVEAPTYMEALEIFQNYTDEIIAVPMDAGGLRLDALEQILAARLATHQVMPTFLYTIPTFQNPTGYTLSDARRRRLLHLAKRYDFLIVEDDAYGEIFFQHPPVALKALDEEKDRVIHVGSLSKVLGPGLRVGWSVGPAPIIDAMSVFKKDLDHTFVEAAVGCYLEHSDWPAQLATIRTTYRARCDEMLHLLAKSMPPDVTWTTPQGGYFVWVHVPGVDTLALLPHALQAGVAYIPGYYFYPAPIPAEGAVAPAGACAGTEYLRLSFSHVSPTEMACGIERLAAAIRAVRGD